MPTTIRDLAKTLNVSHTTVSRVLNGRQGAFISEATRQRVLAVAQEMNYRPNRAARQLATGRANMIAVWIQNTTLPYIAAVTEHVESLVRQRDLGLVYAIGDRAHVENDLTYSVDGILALDQAADVTDFVRSAPSPHPPIVSMGCYVCRDLDYVEVDLGVGVRAAVTHLLESGCRRVAYLVSEFGMREGDARRLAYDDVMRQWGREPEHLVLPKEERAPSRALIRERFRQNNHPDGLFCFSDDMAIGAYRGLRDLGIRLPDDVALVGCDGVEDTAYFDPPLSTIIQPYEELCARAWSLLKRRMDDPGAPQEHEVLPSQLVIRESSLRVPAVSPIDLPPRKQIP